ncbi:MAG: hypothetical protein ABMA64_13235 [Myxococcota bacterium]
MIWALAALASPPDGLRPVVARAGAVDRYARWAALEGELPARPVCEPVWPEIVDLCYRVWDQGKRRWVVTGDLGAWAADAPALRERVASAAGEWVARAELVPIAGTPHQYLRLVDGDGWTAAGLLRPELAAERLGGGPIRMAYPAETVWIAWRAGDDELDRIMAIGVRELYDATAGSVSPRIVTWDPSAPAPWKPFGQAVP